MGFEEDIEKGKTKKGKTNAKALSFDDAIQMGEYDPNYLATYTEWHKLSRHVQFQYIKKALDNRDSQLIAQWAEVNNVLDFSMKPHLAETLKNIQKQMKKVESDRERLFVEYSTA